jgi:NAD(P)H dehydrogenase (quinone)
MILITGATGNTGSLVVRNLAKKFPPDSIVALVRPQSDIRELTSLGVQTHACDLSIPSSYLPIVEKGSTFVGISNLRHSDEMLPHLVNAKIARAHCVTTTTVFSGYHSYSALYRQIEERLLDVDIPVSLLRPSMI